jgi:serine/threonine protein kinase
MFEQIKETELEHVRAIGEGHFGVVRLVRWRQQLCVQKTFKENVREGSEANFRAELAALQQLRHPRACLFMGACIAQDSSFIVFEYMEGGSLFSRLHKPGAGIGSLSLAAKLTIAHDTAVGLAYIHDKTPPQLHGDLTTENILLDVTGRAKIADFGLSSQKQRGEGKYYDPGPAAGNLIYTAAEVHRGGPYTVTADVMSFALCFFELMYGQLAFGVSSMGPPYSSAATVFVDFIELAYKVGREHARPLLEETTAEAALIRQCWGQEQAQRPSILKVAQQLEEIKLAAMGEDPDPYSEESELETNALRAMGAMVGGLARGVGMYFLGEAGGDASEAATMYMNSIEQEGKTMPPYAPYAYSPVSPGAVDAAGANASGAIWNCASCTYSNQPAAALCAVCSTSKGGGQQSQPQQPPSPPFAPPPADDKYGYRKEESASEDSEHEGAAIIEYSTDSVRGELHLKTKAIRDSWAIVQCIYDPETRSLTCPGHDVLTNCWYENILDRGGGLAGKRSNRFNVHGDAGNGGLLEFAAANDSEKRNWLCAIEGM